MRLQPAHHTKWIILCLVGSVVSSMALLPAALVNSEGKYKVLLIAFALLFWLGLILEQVSIWQADGVMKAEMRKEKAFPWRVGLLSFAATREGLAADMLFAISLIILLICIAFQLGESILQYVLISLVVLSFRMHCILNGKNYRYMKSEKRKVDRTNG